MSINLSALMKQRYDTAANWTAQNPTLLAGEIGIESDTKKWKVGTGATAWTSLVYAIGGTYPIVNADVAAGAAIVDTKLATIATAGKVSNSATTAASANTASAIVARDASGNFTAGTITAALTGAASANVLKAGDTMTGPLVTPAGTVTANGVQVGTGTTYKPGIYSPGADQLAISTGGVGRLFVTSGGLVGVGVTPTAKFESYFSSTNPSLSTNTGAGLSVNGTSTVRLNFGNYPGSPFSSWLQSSDGAGVAYPLVINPLGGNVGIGTTSPNSTLDVQAASARSKLVSTTGTNAAYHTFLNTGGNFYIGLDNSAGGDFSAAYAGAIWHGGAYPLVFGTSNAERARIDSSGRLLVGTSTNTNHIRSGQKITAVATGGDYSGINTTTYAGASVDPAPIIDLQKSRGSTDGSLTSVISEDVLGYVQFRGADGTKFVTSAEIKAIVDGTAGVDDMPGRLVFSTTADGAASPTERMRINAAGQTMIGGGDQEANGTITIYPNNSNGAAQAVWNRTSIVAGTTALNFKNGGTQVGTIVYTNTATAYNTSSDYRLKENVTPITNGITRFQQLKPSQFNFIANPDQTVDGFLAHEAQAVVPECVTGEKDAVDEDGNPVYQGIDQSKLVPLLTAALQEAIAKIEALETRLSALEAA